MIAQVVRDDLGAYRLLGAIFEVPAMLDRLLDPCGPHLREELLIAVHVTAAERLLEQHIFQSSPVPTEPGAKVVVPQKYRKIPTMNDTNLGAALAEADAAIQQKTKELSEDSTRAILGMAMCEIDRAILHANDNSPAAVRRSLIHMHGARKILDGVLISFGKNLG